MSLEDALEHHGITLDETARAQTQAYCDLLWEWNEKLNLTRHLDAETFVARDVLDAYHLAPHLAERERVLDIGSGGGVPGILLAILRPDLRVTLCDSIQKKTRALESMVRTLSLPTHVVNARIQDHLKKKRYDTLVARAVGPLAKIVGWVKPHTSQFGRLLLIKGPRWIEERKEARHRGLMQGLDLRKIHSYPMPGTESESVLLQVTAEGEATTS